MTRETLIAVRDSQPWPQWVLDALNKRILACGTQIAKAGDS